MDYILSTDL